MENTAKVRGVVIMDILIRIFAAMLFLFLYNKIINYYQTLINNNAKMIDFSKISETLASFWNDRFGDKDKQFNEFDLPDEYYRLVRKVNIASHSRKYLVTWLGEENAPEELKKRVMQDQSENDPVTIEELDDILSELYRQKLY